MPKCSFEDENARVGACLLLRYYNQFFRSWLNAEISQYPQWMITESAYLCPLSSKFFCGVRATASHRETLQQSS